MQNQPVTPEEQDAEKEKKFTDFYELGYEEGIRMATIHYKKSMNKHIIITTVMIILNIAYFVLIGIATFK